MTNRWCCLAMRVAKLSSFFLKNASRSSRLISLFCRPTERSFNSLVADHTQEVGAHIAKFENLYNNAAYDII